MHRTNPGKLPRLSASLSTKREQKYLPPALTTSSRIYRTIFSYHKQRTGKPHGGIGDRAAGSSVLITFDDLYQGNIKIACSVS